MFTRLFFVFGFIITTGLLFGFLMDLVVVALFSKFGVQIAESLLAFPQVFIIPVLSAIGMAVIAKKRENMDVLSTG